MQIQPAQPAACPCPADAAEKSEGPAPAFAIDPEPQIPKLGGLSPAGLVHALQFAPFHEGKGVARMDGVVHLNKPRQGTPGEHEAMRIPGPYEPGLGALVEP